MPSNTRRHVTAVTIATLLTGLTLTRRQDVRIFASLALCGASLLMSACGGSDDGSKVDRVVMFGDSLSDVGAYTSTTSPQRGKWTTNPGPVWIETVAKEFNYTITPAEVGFGDGPVTQCPKAGCTGYAEGGSRATDPNGVGHTDLVTGKLQLLTRSVKSQIDLHVSSKGGFTPKDLVFIFVGPNDVFSQWGAIGVAAGTPGATPASVAAATTAAHAAARQAGKETAAYARRVKDGGAGFVYVMGSTNVAKIPLSTMLEAGTPGTIALLDALSVSFNKGLNDELAVSGAGIGYIDIYAFTSDQAVRPTAYGMPADINVTGVACDSSKLPPDFLANSLYCNLQTLVSPGAETKYLFADISHPSTIGHRAYSDLVIKRLKSDGLL